MQAITMEKWILILFAQFLIHANALIPDYKKKDK
jgi:hypothetical protein